MSKEKEDSPDVGNKGVKRKAQEAVDESLWIPFVIEYAPSPEISTKYMNTPHYMSASEWLPHWGMQEAVRELLANMIDQARKVAENPFFRKREIEFSEEPGRFIIHIGNDLLAEARWNKKVCKYVSNYVNGGCIKAKALEDQYEHVETHQLELINYASYLPRTSFNVGVSSKRDSQTMIGKHGEGLTGACVVLNRNGCNLFADCTHFNYTASVLNFKNSVYYQLKRYTKKSNLPDNAVRFTVIFNPANEEVNPETLMRSVRLPTAASTAGITTSRGTLLIDKTLRGKQFNRSIFVGEDASCLFGYDFVDPDKNLMQGRDRNMHGKDKCLVECGRILSEAILANEEVRKEVLKCFLFSADYRSNGPAEEKLKNYSDLLNGEELSAEAVSALRLQHETDNHAGKKSIYCARESLMLREIQAASDMSMTYSHRLLHNHAAVIKNFNATLVAGSHDMSPDSRIGAHEEEIVALLGVRELQQSPMLLPGALTGFWILHNIAYVTSAGLLGARDAVSLSEEQEVNIHSTLHACAVPVRNIVKIMRLLRNQPDLKPLPPPSPITLDDATQEVDATIKTESDASLTLPLADETERNDFDDGVSDFGDSVNDDGAVEAVVENPAPMEEVHPAPAPAVLIAPTVPEVTPPAAERNAGLPHNPEAARAAPELNRVKQEAGAPAPEDDDMSVDQWHLIPPLPRHLHVGGRDIERLSRHLGSGVWVYGENPLDENRIAQQLEICVGSAKHQHRLLLLSEFVHIVVYMTAATTTAPGLRLGPHCVCINIGDDWCPSDKLFRHFLGIQLQGQGLIQP